METHVLENYLLDLRKLEARIFSPDTWSSASEESSQVSERSTWDLALFVRLECSLASPLRVSVRLLVLNMSIQPTGSEALRVLRSVGVTSVLRLVRRSVAASTPDASFRWIPFSASMRDCNRTLKTGRRLESWHTSSIRR